MPCRAFVPSAAVSFLRRYGLAAGAVLVALLLTILIRPLLTREVFALFFVAVLVSAWYGGLAAGLFATLLSIVVADYFIVPPRGVFYPSLDTLIRLGAEAFAALFVSSLIATRRRVEADLYAGREQLRITLASIGDAVIATDLQGRVTLMNAVAEELTGWPYSEAVGRDLTTIFQIINEHTRAPAENPVARVIRDGMATGLGNHTLLIARDGTERPIDDSGAPIRDAKGAISGVVLVFRDTSTRRQAEQIMARYQLLSENARDIILFIRPDGRIVEANRAAVTAYGYDHDTLLTMSIYDLRGPATTTDVATQMAQADAGGILFETVHHRSDGSLFPVEVSSRGALIGGERLLLSIIRDITVRRRTEEAQHFLAEASATLASELDYQARLEAIASLAVPTLADWCAVDIVTDDGAIQSLAVAHVDPAKVAWAVELRQRYPPDPNAPGGVPKVIRTGQSELYPDIPDSLLVTAARDADHLRLLRQTGMRSAMFVPLTARGRRLGALTMVATESGRRYGPEDLGLAMELAHRAALAVDNARLHAAEQMARQAAEQAADCLLRLQAVTTALAEALTPAQVADVILSQGIAALGARAGSIALLTGNGTELELAGVAGYPPEVVAAWRRFPLTTSVPLADAIRTGTPIWLESRAVREAAYPHLASLQTSSDQAWAAIPLLGDRHPIGAMGLNFAAARSFTASDQDLMITLARQCAQALERARLYEAEQRARTAAEAAVRLRDQFLSIAAHELKTPLTSLLGYIQLFQRRIERAGTLGERDQQALHVIAGQAARLHKMVLTLLDLARIETGQLSVERVPLDLCALVRRLADEMRPTLDQHPLHLICPATPLLVAGDELRLEQVLQNLIQNAAKYSPAGRPITVEVTQRADRGCVAVADQGIGIPQDALPQLFQRFYRAPNAEEQQIAGIGVGLYVVKEIVALHGGEVHVDSTEGVGSTFAVCFPLLESALASPAPTECASS